MGFRITGISTPVGGISWEYTERMEAPTPPSLQPGRKIAVFISSNCKDEERYDDICLRLKTKIEGTGLAKVYFSNSEKAVLATGQTHNSYDLEDSDICIFLIDNATVISGSVRKAIDIVRKNQIHTRYYFCDENQKEETALQKSILGSTHEISRTISSFESVVADGADDIIDEVVAIYHHYCRGRLLWKTEGDESVQKIDISKTEIVLLKTIPKSVLKNIDQCSDYLAKFSVGHHFGQLCGGGR